jgi:hypothetical protein
MDTILKYIIFLSFVTIYITSPNTGNNKEQMYNLRLPQRYLRKILSSVI